MLQCLCATEIRAGVLCNTKDDTDDGTQTTGIWSGKITMADQRHNEWALPSYFILNGLNFIPRHLMWYGHESFTPWKKKTSPPCQRNKNTYGTYKGEENYQGIRDSHIRKCCAVAKMIRSH